MADKAALTLTLNMQLHSGREFNDRRKGNKEKDKTMLTLEIAADITC